MANTTILNNGVRIWDVSVDTVDVDGYDVTLVVMNTSYSNPVEISVYGYADNAVHTLYLTEDAEVHIGAVSRVHTFGGYTRIIGRPI